jgi:glycosyltransferase involved in cell wall biosynthesis
MNILITSILDLKKASHNSRLHQFLRYLSQRHNVTVISINDHWKGRYDDRSLEYSKDFDDIFNRITIVYLTEENVSPVLQEITSVFAIGRKLNGLSYSDFDVHFNYNSLVSGYEIAKRLNSRDIGTVYDIADDLPGMVKTSSQIPALLRPVAGWYANRIFEKNIALARRVTLTTSIIGQSYSIPHGKLELIPNGVDIHLFKLSDGDGIRDRYKINECFIVGHVGVMREWLDLRPLFGAIRRLKSAIDVKLLLVGAGSEFERTRRLAEQFGIQDSVIFTGTVPYNQVPEYISCMDACVIPFAADTVAQNSLPLKLFEYMACEKPVISSSIEGIRQTFQNEVLFADSTDDYFNRLMELHSDPSMRRELGRRGREIVEKGYQWEVLSSRLENLFQKVSETS